MGGFQSRWQCAEEADITAAKKKRKKSFKLRIRTVVVSLTNEARGYVE